MTTVYIFAAISATTVALLAWIVFQLLGPEVDQVPQDYVVRATATVVPWPKLEHPLLHQRVALAEAEARQPVGRHSWGVVGGTDAQRRAATITGEIVLDLDAPTSDLTRVRPAPGWQQRPVMGQDPFIVAAPLPTTPRWFSDARMAVR